MSGVRRRTLLGAMAAVAPLAGCSAIGRAVGVGGFVRVAVSWSATELAAFRAVLAGWGGDDFELLPLGDDIDAALGARTAGRPNVVALPQLGSAISNIEPLPNDLWHPEYDRIWSQRLPAGGRYALPFKLAHKSVVWYRKPIFDRHGLAPPRTWAEWLTLNDTIANTGLAPLALGGADGWMLDGFFENVLLRNFSSTYETLTRDHDRQVWAGDDIRTTFEMLAEMWGRPGALAGGSGRALVQQFPDAVLEVFSYGKAAMVVAPDFAESVIRQFGVPDNEVGTFTFPPVTPPGGPLVIAGDLLVATKPLTDAALDLISYLGTAAAPIPWIRDTGGFIAANPDTDRSFYSPTLARLSDELRTHDVSFDLSDQLGPVGGREGLQLVLQNFVERLGSGTSHAESVRIAVRDMIAVEAR